MNPRRDERRTGMERRGRPGMVVLGRSGNELARWPLPARRCDLALVDELARLQLAARRIGCAIAIQEVEPDLRELLDLCGLVEVLGQPEVREQRRVEEVVVTDDPVA